jgi:hypothetical protein
MEARMKPDLAKKIHYIITSEDFAEAYGSCGDETTRGRASLEALSGLLSESETLHINDKILTQDISAGSEKELYDKIYEKLLDL